MKEESLNRTMWKGLGIFLGAVFGCLSFTFLALLCVPAVVARSSPYKDTAEVFAWLSVIGCVLIGPAVGCVVAMRLGDYLSDKLKSTKPWYKVGSSLTLLIGVVGVDIILLETIARLLKVVG